MQKQDLLTDKNKLAVRCFELIRDGHTQGEAADKIGISYKTLNNWKKRHYQKWIETGLINIRGSIKTDSQDSKLILYKPEQKQRVKFSKPIKKEKIFAFYWSKLAIKELIEELDNE